MKQLALAIFLAFTTPVLAHPGEPGHHHAEPSPVTEAQARERAKTAVVKKVNQGKLPDRWRSIKASKSYKKSFGHGPEWVVEFHDTEPAEDGKKVLYVYLSLTGKALGLNFTGE